MVLITGPSSGIGRATAIAFGAAGAKVALAGLRPQRLEEVSTKIKNSGGEALVLPTDVSDENQAKQMVEKTLERFGTLDIFVSNAGLVSGSGPFIGSSPSDWKKMFNVNVLGALYGLEPSIAAMRKNGEGHIFIVSSGAGRWLYPGAPVYSGTKFALSSIAEMIRRELAQDPIRVTSIEPGIVMTEIFNGMGEGAKEAAVASTSGEPLQPEDIADAILYAATRPAHVNLNIMTIYPSGQAL